MIGNRFCAFVLSTAFAIIASALPAAAAPFDGSWNMALVTTSGHCGVIKIGMAVNGGHISATSGRFVMHKISLAGGLFPARARPRSKAWPARVWPTASDTSRDPKASASGTVPDPPVSARAFGLPFAPDTVLTRCLAEGSRWSQ
jgi:hypothetical protein